MHHIIVTELIKSEAIRMNSANPAASAELPFGALWRKLSGLFESRLTATARTAQRECAQPQRTMCTCEAVR